MKTNLLPHANGNEAVIQRSSFIIHRLAFTLVELLVVIAIIGILISLLLPAIQASRESARRTECLSNLAQLSVAAQNYEMAHEAFPAGVIDQAGPIRSEPKGNHHNWLTQLLPYMEENNVYRNVDQTVSVYDAKNAPARATQLRTLVCPSDPGDYGTTNVLGNLGPTNTPLGQSSYAGVHHDVESPIDADNHGLLYLNSKIRYDDIADGAKHTLLFGEKRYDDADLGWISGTRATLRNTGHAINTGLPRVPALTMPADPNAIPDPAVNDVAAMEGAAAAGAFTINPPSAVEPPAGGQTTDEQVAADAAPTAVAPTAKVQDEVKPPEEAGKQIAKAEAKPDAVPAGAAAPANAAPAAPADPVLFVGGFNSFHHAGVNFVFADGSVRFIPETIDLLILQQLAHRADGKLPSSEY